MTLLPRKFQTSDDVNLQLSSRCEAFSTYPRTYDLVHADGVFSMYQDRYIIAQSLFSVCIHHNCILQDRRCLFWLFYLNHQTWLVLLHPGVTFLTCWSRWTVYWGLKERCWWGTRWTSSTRLCWSLKVCDGSAEWQTTRTVPSWGRRLWSVWRRTGLV